MQGSLTFLVVPTRQHHMSPAHSYPGDPRAVSQNGTPTTTTPGRHGVIHLKVSQLLFQLEDNNFSIELTSES